MPKSPQQKLKLLYLQKILLENTDEQHGLTLNEIIGKLASYGISAERKSIYDDIAALNSFGMDICVRRDKQVRYYVASREFEMPELKLLVDAIQSSRFITQKKSRELISKLEGLSSVYGGKLLQRRVYVLNRVKAENERIYYSVDALHDAICEGRKIRFKYNEITLDFSASRHFIMQERRGGEYYCASPWILTWENENYYLIAYDHKPQAVRHFRVDKMTDIIITDEDAERMDKRSEAELADYSKRVFSMFGGRTAQVTLRFENRLAGVCADKFGTDVFVRSAGGGHFEVTAQVEISHQFYGWLLGLGSGVRLTAPAQEVELFREYVNSIAAVYE